MDGYPEAVSPASDVVTDPSSNPMLALGTGGTWVTAFTDVAGGDESDADIRADVEDATVELVKDGSVDQIGAGLARGQEGAYGLLYVHDVGSAQALDYRGLDSALSAYPNQSGRFTSVQGGEIRASRLIRAGSSFAAAWVESVPGPHDILNLAIFESCVSQ